MALRLSHDEWIAEAKRRYPSSDDIRFVCPSCGFVQARSDFEALGMRREVIGSFLGFSCIGRYMPDRSREAFAGGPGPCNYAGGGLIRIAPIIVHIDDRDYHAFDFADDPLVPRESLLAEASAR